MKNPLNKNKKPKDKINIKLILVAVALAAVFTLATYVFAYFVFSDWSFKGHLIFSLIVGLILLPIVLTLLVSAFIAILTGVIFVVVSAYVFIYDLLPKRDKKPVENPNELEDYLLNNGYVSGNKENFKDINLSMIGEGDTPPTEFYFSKIVSNTLTKSWAIYSDFIVIAYCQNSTKLPNFIVNSRLNDNTFANVNTKAIPTESIDLGSDFGRYYTVHVSASERLEALQILGPDAMLEWMNIGVYFDVIAHPNVQYYVFSNSLKNINYQKIDADSEKLNAILIEGSNKKTNSVAQKIFRLKKQVMSAPSLVGRLLGIMMMITFVMIISIIFGSLVPEDAPIWLSAIFLIPFVLGFILDVIVVAIFGYIFLIYIFASMLTGFIKNIRVLKLKRTYKSLGLKYS